MRRQYPQISFDCLDDAFDFAGADHRIHFRHLLENLVAKAFYQAPCHDQFFRRAEFLVLGHFQNRVDRFFLRGFNEAARIHDQDFGILRARRQFVAIARQQAHHDLAIDEVFGASERDKSNLGCGS